MFGDPEIWRNIRHFPNHAVSSEGRVMDVVNRTQVELMWNEKAQERWVSFSYYERTYKGPVWRLMLVAFYDLVNHRDVRPDYRDGDSDNLDIFNLRWQTLDGLPIMFRREDSGDWKRIRRNGRQVRIVETGQIFNSVAECAREIGGSSNAIYICLRGERKKHHGFTFEYLGEPGK